MNKDSSPRPAAKRRVGWRVPLLVLLVVASIVARHLYYRYVWEYTGPKIPIGKDTTFVTEPVDAEGYLDFESALNSRLKQGITPKTNANVLIWKALGPRPEGGMGMPSEYFEQLGIDEPPANGDYLVGLTPFLIEQQKSPVSRVGIVGEQLARARNRPWLATDFPQLASWLKINEKALAVAREATRRPDYFNPLVSKRINGKATGLISALLPSVQKCREIASALCASAMLRVGEGKFDEAWKDLLACHRLGRLVGRGATLIDALVGIAIDQIASAADLAYLERTKLSAGQIGDRLNDLRSLPELPNLADKVDLGERFMFLDTLQLIRRGKFDGLGIAGLLKEQLTPRKLDRIDWTPAFRNGMKMYDRIAEASRLPDRVERLQQLSEIEAELAQRGKESQNNDLSSDMFSSVPSESVGTSIGNVMIGLFVPANTKFQNAVDRAQQTQRNLQLAFALAAYRADHGSYPAKLDDLSPKYVPSIPNDLFCGAALVYRPDEKGYLLYSVGVNGIDEGGRTADDESKGDDIAVRMPLPEIKEKK
jgi:hypothetical protein